MAWLIEFVPAAAKELKKLGRTEAARSIATLETRIAALDDPRTLGSALTGDRDAQPVRGTGEHRDGGLWRWRIGDYRVIARIEDERITILVVRVGHRREVYRR